MLNSCLLLLLIISRWIMLWKKDPCSSWRSLYTNDYKYDVIITSSAAM